MLAACTPRAVERAPATQQTLPRVSRVTQTTRAGMLPPDLTTTTTRRPPRTDPRFDTCTEAHSNGYGPYWRGRDPEYAFYDDRDRNWVVCD